MIIQLSYVTTIIIIYYIQHNLFFMDFVTEPDESHTCVIIQVEQQVVEQLVHQSVEQSVEQVVVQPVKQPVEQPVQQPVQRTVRFVLPEFPVQKTGTFCKLIKSLNIAVILQQKFNDHILEYRVASRGIPDDSCCPHDPESTKFQIAMVYLAFFCVNFSVMMYGIYDETNNEIYNNISVNISLSKCAIINTCCHLLSIFILFVFLIFEKYHHHTIMLVLSLLYVANYFVSVIMIIDLLVYSCEKNCFIYSFYSFYCLFDISFEFVLVLIHFLCPKPLDIPV